MTNAEDIKGIIESLNGQGIGCGPVQVHITILCGMQGNEIVPVKVDSAGRMVTIMSEVAEV